MGLNSARVSNLQAVLFDEIVTVVRGTASFTIPRTELSDFIGVLQQLADVDGAGNEVASSQAKPPQPRPGKPRKSDASGALWAEVRRYLDSCARAQGVKSIVRHVKRAGVVGGDPTQAVERLLSTQMRQRTVSRTKSGRYALTSPNPAD